MGLIEKPSWSCDQLGSLQNNLWEQLEQLFLQSLLGLKNIQGSLQIGKEGFDMRACAQTIKSCAGLRIDSCVGLVALTSAKD